MQRNLAWPIFLSIISILVVVFTSLLSIDLYRYRQLKSNVIAKELEGSVYKIGSNQYKIEVEYLYDIQGREYSKQQVIKKLTYKNVWLANQAIDALKENEINVWYNPHEPKMGTIEKSFPYRRLLSTIVLFGIFLYFCLLSRYMLKRV